MIVAFSTIKRSSLPIMLPALTVRSAHVTPFRVYGVRCLGQFELQFVLARGHRLRVIRVLLRQLTHGLVPRIGAHTHGSNFANICLCFKLSFTRQVNYRQPGFTVGSVEPFITIQCQFMVRSDFPDNAVDHRLIGCRYNIALAKAVPALLMKAKRYAGRRAVVTKRAGIRAAKRWDDILEP